jgi:hypothetical protein
MPSQDPLVPRARLVLLAIVVLFSIAAFFVACGGGGSTSTTQMPPSGAPNQLGTVTAVNQLSSCPPSAPGVVPPVVGTSCYDLTVSCPGVASYSGVELKVSAPSGTSQGTVIYTTGGGGNQFYEDQFVYGNVAVNTVVSAGFTAVQTNFNSQVGWLDGPGGPLKLSCRWATTAQWVHDNIAAGTPLCATGNSGGAGVIAYALSRYGEDSIFSYVEPTSGPPFSRIDYGCRCQQTTEMSKCAGTLDTCYGMDANLFLDPAYQNNNCSSHSAAAADVQTWQADSILSSDNKSLLNYGSTRVHFVFGSLDSGSGSAEAVLWENAITSQHDSECVADGPHKIADVMDGATRIAMNLTSNCH